MTQETATTAAPGVTTFARYAYPPNELGYCGPDDASALLAHTTSGTGGHDVAGRAPAFDGAWVYLQVIGAATGRDPLDAKVVDAYWLGNELLAEVDPGALLATLADRLAGQVGGLLPRVPASQHVLAHHGFHVFAVYPWAKMLGRGGDVPLTVLQACRIRWGTVVSVSTERADVLSRPLTWDGSCLALGEPVVESVRWASAGRHLREGPAPGDIVSMHWDWVCDRITGVQAEALAGTTAHALDLTNALLTPPGDGAT